MSENQAAQQNGTRNPFENTGIVVAGIVRELANWIDSKTGLMKYELRLATTSNAELRINLEGQSDPAKYVQGSLARVKVKIREWVKKDGSGKSGMMLVEVP